MSALATVITRVIEREGAVFTDLAADHGGPTKYGITLPFWADVSGHTHTGDDLHALTEEQAKVIYLNWLQQNRIDEIQDLGVLDAVVDFAVHSGMRAGVKALQRALDVPQDGIIGPVTLTALADADAPTLVKWIMAQRLRKLGTILGSDPSQSVFARGWLHRIAGLLEA